MGALRLSISGWRMAQPAPHCGRRNSSETVGKRRTCRWKLPPALPTSVNMITFARDANPPLTDDSALTALIQSNDMLRDASDEAWAPMLQKAQDIVARHPEFAFGHSILAAAYAWASESDNVPDRAQAMRDAARREAILTLKLDPEDAGAYAVLSGFVPTYDHRWREAILLRGIRFAEAPKAAACRIIFI